MLQHIAFAGEDPLTHWAADCTRYVRVMSAPTKEKVLSHTEHLTFGFGARLCVFSWRINSYLSLQILPQTEQVGMGLSALCLVLR